MKPQSEKAEGEMPRGGGNGDVVKDARDKILGYVVKYAGETFKDELVNNPGGKPEGDAVKDAGDEILGYAVKYAGESLKAELFDKSGKKLEGDAVKDAGDEIQGYVVKSAGEIPNVELVHRETRKADVGEKSTDPIKDSIKGKADSSGTIKAEPAKISNKAEPAKISNKAEPAKISNKADAHETPKANSIEGCADVETVKDIDGEEGDASKEEAGDEAEEEAGDEEEEEEEGDGADGGEEADEADEGEEADEAEEGEEGDESEEEEEGDESEEEDQGRRQAMEINSKIELMEVLNGWVGGRLLMCVRRLPSMAEAGRLYTYVKSLGDLVEVRNIEALKMVSDLEGLIEFKVMKATIPTLREHPQQAAARDYLAKQGRQLVGRGLQIGGEFRVRAEAVGNAMQAHSQLVNEPPYSVSLNNLRKTINSLLNSPVALV